MGIYINGMEMPKDEIGYRGYKDIRVWHDGTVEVLSGYNIKETSHKAVFVPPHGRLIDADALIASENQHYEYHSDSFYVETRTIELAQTIIEADMDVMYYPQVDGITPTVIKAEAEET